MSGSIGRMLSVIRRVCPETIAQINVILFINESNSLLSRSSTAIVNVIFHRCDDKDKMMTISMILVIK